MKKKGCFNGCIMNITDLIKKLQEIKEKHGDIKVAVQYRDSGGYYGGADEELELCIEECSDCFSNNIKKDEKVLLL